MTKQDAIERLRMGISFIYPLNDELGILSPRVNKALTELEQIKAELESEYWEAAVEVVKAYADMAPEYDD